MNFYTQLCCEFIVHKLCTQFLKSVSHFFRFVALNKQQIQQPQDGAEPVNVITGKQQA